MNKGELVDALVNRLGDRRAAHRALDAVLTEIQRAVSKGVKVSIAGFGVFEKRERGARTARNPRTGETVKVRKTSVPAFRAGQAFKDVVVGRKKLPPVAKATATAPTSAARATASRAVSSSTAKKTAAKKTTAKKTTAKKTTAKKTTAAKKSAAKKTTAKKAPAKKSTAKKTTAAKKAPAKKSTAKKTTAKKTTAKKTAAKKAPAKKSATKATKSTRR